MNLLQKYHKFIALNSQYNMEKYYKYIHKIDHIAFRSLNKNENIFDDKCIKQNDNYYFSEYNVEAEWYKVPIYNRIFNSYYLNNTNLYDINTIINKIFIENKRFGDLFTYNDYIQIYRLNQYLAWTLLHRNDINHIALEIDNIYDFTNRLIKDKYDINIVNNKIYNVLYDKKIIQTSIKAEYMYYKFINGIYKIPYTFVEFIQRLDNRDGFDNQNANKIIYSIKILKL